ncbi:MAG: phospholipid/cholesterol/gamma-HCH transport system substrate-binding protein, partial [Planctomycetota bacterium]
MNTTRQFILGLFFLGALSTLVFYTLFFTDFTLFEETVVETVYFPDASGLRAGDPVMVAGLRVGRVGEIGFNMDAPNEERIEVRLLLDVPVTLRTDYLISIEETTMLGGRHISVEPGRFEGDALQLAEGQNLRGTVAENPLAALGAVGDLVDRNAEAFGNILKSLEETVAKINAGEGTAGRLINNVQLGRDLSEAVASIRTVAENLAVTTADINAGRGVIGALVNDDLLVSDLKAIVADIRSIAGDLSEGRGTLGRFLKDDSMAD